MTGARPHLPARGGCRGSRRSTRRYPWPRQTGRRAGHRPGRTLLPQRPRQRRAPDPPVLAPPPVSEPRAPRRVPAFRRDRPPEPRDLPPGSPRHWPRPCVRSRSGIHGPRWQAKAWHSAPPPAPRAQSRGCGQAPETALCSEAATGQATARPASGWSDPTSARDPQPPFAARRPTWSG